MEIRLELSKKWLLKNIEKLNKKAIEDMPNEEGIKDKILIEWEQEENDTIEITKEDETLRVWSIDNNNNYVTIETKLDTFDLIKILETAVKKFNKIKSFFESLK